MSNKKTVVCEECCGTGIIEDDECQFCMGEGRVEVDPDETWEESEDVVQDDDLNEIEEDYDDILDDMESDLDEFADN
ncbi:MAG: hypothetical protein GY835_17450 [bacterium]|nr:hypothetical protein [bacterium]